MVNSAILSSELYYHGLIELEGVAKKIIDQAVNKKIWIFDGEMGAGKTTLIKAICKLLGSEDHVSSPTFSIVNEYRDTDDQAIYHFDFYRIKDEQEASDIGVEEYLDSDALCLIEWPSKIPSLLPEKDVMSLEIKVISEEERKILITHHD